MKKLFQILFISLAIFCFVISADTPQTKSDTSSSTDSSTNDTPKNESTDTGKTTTTDSDKNQETDGTKSSPDADDTPVTDANETSTTDVDKSPEADKTSTTDADKSTDAEEAEDADKSTDSADETPDQGAEAEAEDDDTTSATVKGVTLKVKGHSGKMTISRTNEDNTTSSVDIEFDSISEVDANGTAVGKSSNPKHSFNTFANQNFTIEEPVADKFQNLTVRLVKMVTTKIVDDNTRLRVFVYVFEQAGTIEVGANQTQNVTEGSVKFSVDVENWPFCTANGTASTKCTQGKTEEVGKYLDFAIKVSGKEALTKKDNGYSFGSGNLFLSNSVRVDDSTEWTTLPENYPTLSDKGVFTFRFDKFTKNVLYDPVVEIAKAGSTSRFLIVSWTLCILVLGLLF